MDCYTYIKFALRPLYGREYNKNVQAVVSLLLLSSSAYLLSFKSLYKFLTKQNFSRWAFFSGSFFSQQFFCEWVSFTIHVLLALDICSRYASYFPSSFFLLCVYFLFRLLLLLSESGPIYFLCSMKPGRELCSTLVLYSLIWDAPLNCFTIHFKFTCSFVPLFRVFIMRMSQLSRYFEKHDMIWKFFLQKY